MSHIEPFPTPTTQPRHWLARLSLALLLALATTFVLSATDADAAKKKREKNYILSESTARQMLKVGEAAEEEDWDEVLDLLEPLTRRRRLKPHDKATVFGLVGQAWAAKEDYVKAAEAFEVALAQNAQVSTTQEFMKFNLAQLYMATENYERATELFEDWFANAENPNAQANFMMAAAYMVQEKFDKALPYARTCVEKSDEPTERYLRLLLGAEFQNGNLLQTFDVLKTLATHFPKKEYFLQLAAAYYQAGENENSLAMMELAYREGWLEKESELVGLAQRYYAADLPYRASQVMRKALEAEQIAATKENYEFYANSLLNARHYDESLVPLEKAASLSEDGELYVRLAQVYLEIQDWPKARGALKSALDKSELNNPGNAHLLLGIANFNEKRFDSAREEFQRAAKFDKTRKSANQWIRHVETALRDMEDL